MNLNQFPDREMSSSSHSFSKSSDSSEIDSSTAAKKPIKQSIEAKNEQEINKLIEDTFSNIFQIVQFEKGTVENKQTSESISVNQFNKEKL